MKLIQFILFVFFTKLSLFNPVFAASENQLPNLNFPASFEGTLPCADCAGIQTQVNLWDDGVFHIEETYLGTEDGDVVFMSLGRWHVDPAANNKIYLHGSKEAPAIYTILEDGKLELMDRHGQKIESTLSYTLTPMVFTPIEINTKMTGEFRYMADAASFKECLTQRSYPVAMKADYPALEKAYSETNKSQPGDPVVVSIDAQVMPHQSMEASQGDIDTVIVNRFIGIADGLKCERALSQASLVNTYWSLKTLDGQAVKTLEEGRQPHMVLQDMGDRKMISATAGCNRIRGSYQVNGDQITFDSNGMAMTLMACPPPLDEREKTFTTMLNNARTWNIESQLLEFFDADGKTIALFEAVYLP